jgi:hypothetical protein
MEEDEMGNACSMYGRDGGFKTSVGKPEVKRPLR